MESEVRINGDAAGGASGGFKMDAEQNGQDAYVYAQITASDGNDDMVLATSNEFDYSVKSHHGVLSLFSYLNIPNSEYWEIRDSVTYKSGNYSVLMDHYYDRHLENSFKVRGIGQYKGTFYNG